MKKDNVRFLPAPDADPLEGTPISLLSGHSCRVYETGTDGERGTWIHQKFRKHAIAAGCGIVGMEEHIEAVAARPDKMELTVKAIEALIEANDPNSLDGNGRPKLANLKKQAGFGITKEEADAAWSAFEASLDA